MNNTIEKGYTVIYDTTDGKIGFIGIDDHSGGYPFFSSRVESRNVFTEIGKAFRLRRSLANMKTYCGHERIKFDTVRVVRMSEVFSGINEDEDKLFLKQTMEKLSEDELNILTRYLGGSK